MSDRERLIELFSPFADGTYNSSGIIIDGTKVDDIVDHLLANGVIVPPCKVGDVVYDICTIFDESTLKPKTIIKPRIIDFVSTVSFLIESKGLVICEKDFGKTVFLTKEKAEAKLKEREGK